MAARRDQGEQRQADKSSAQVRLVAIVIAVTMLREAYDEIAADALGVGVDWQQAIKGLILLLAVVLDIYNKKKKAA